MQSAKRRSRQPGTTEEESTETEGRLPNFLIIGAMKSGTSSLRNAFRDHPQAFCANEPHFFCDRFDDGLSWYRKQFVSATDQRAVGDKCPDYLYLPRAVARMAETIPTARLIVMLRDPVDRAYSNYWHERREGREKLTFVDALDAESDRLSRGLWGFGYTDMGRYELQLTRLATLYPRESIHVLLFEDFRKDPGRSFGSVCRFLGIDDTVRPSILDKAHNPYRKERFPRSLHFMKRHKVFQRLPLAVSKRLKRVLIQPAEYPAMESSVRSLLEHRFADDNAALASWMGRTNSPWGEPAS